MTRFTQLSVFGIALFLASACSKQATDEGAASEAKKKSADQQSQVKKIALQIEAQFEALPAGALIVAPVARDRRYQKITKTEHMIEPKQGGFGGVSEQSVDKENLIYVSGSLKGGAATYKASYEVEIRSMRPGVFDSIAGQSYGEFNDPKLKKALADVAEPAADPHAVVSEAFESAKAKTDLDAYGIASEFAKALKAGGVPHRLVQGLVFGQSAAKPHVWTEALLPQLGWAPFDPFLARSEAGDESAYRGQHPPDRLRILFGDTFVLKEKAKRAELTLASPFFGPYALTQTSDGATKSIQGKVTYTTSIL